MQKKTYAFVRRILCIFVNFRVLRCFITKTHERVFWIFLIIARGFNIKNYFRLEPFHFYSETQSVLSHSFFIFRYKNICKENSKNVQLQKFIESLHWREFLWLDCFSGIIANSHCKQILKLTLINSLPL